jgi:hypothetical protein
MLDKRWVFTPLPVRGVGNLDVFIVDRKDLGKLALTAGGLRDWGIHHGRVCRRVHILYFPLILLNDSRGKLDFVDVWGS